MSHSLNETEALAKRAARGAGYSWGLAEEAAKAVRWLCANGLDGCAVLAHLLDQVDGNLGSGLSPLSVAGDWQGASGRLCPLTAGACLADHAAMLGDHPIVLHNVLSPALILPFVSVAAAATGTTVRLSWGGRQVVCDASGLGRATDASALTALDVANLRVGLDGTTIATTAPATRATPDATDWATLTRFAHRTYAPATEASRLLGAGAGTNDND